MAFVALLDACVLVNAAVRDSILRAAASEAFGLQVAFSRDILDEVRRTLVNDLGRTPEEADYLIGEILTAFEDGLVEGYEDLVPGMLNDPKDRHVLAAAVRAEAGVLVTFNVRHFSPAACEPFDLEVHTPDEFLTHLWDLNARTMADLLTEQSQALRRPQMHLCQLLDRSERDVPAFAQAARESGLLNLVVFG